MSEKLPTNYNRSDEVKKLTDEMWSNWWGRVIEATSCDEVPFTHHPFEQIKKIVEEPNRRRRYVYLSDSPFGFVFEKRHKLNIGEDEGRTSYFLRVFSFGERQELLSLVRPPTFQVIAYPIFDKSACSQIENPIHVGMSYSEYLETDHWREISDRAKAAANNRCQLCGRSDAELHVHHNNYRRANGMESLSDLIVLCAECHSEFHDRVGVHSE